jgi:hypothetical protein
MFAVRILKIDRRHVDVQRNDDRLDHIFYNEPSNVEQHAHPRARAAILHVIDRRTLTLTKQCICCFVRLHWIAAVQSRSDASSSFVSFNQRQTCQ